MHSKHNVCFVENAIVSHLDITPTSPVYRGYKTNSILDNLLGETLSARKVDYLTIRKSIVFGKKTNHRMSTSLACLERSVHSVKGFLDSKASFLLI